VEVSVPILDARAVLEVVADILSMPTEAVSAPILDTSTAALDTIDTTLVPVVDIEGDV
jgi:hypothetical protein